MLSVRNLFKKKEEVEAPIQNDTITKYYLNSVINLISDPPKRERPFQMSIIDIRNLMLDIDYANYTTSEYQKERLIITAKDRSKQFIIDYTSLTVTICNGGLLYDIQPLVPHDSGYHG